MSSDALSESVSEYEVFDLNINDTYTYMSTTTDKQILKIQDCSSSHNGYLITRFEIDRIRYATYSFNYSDSGSYASFVPNGSSAVIALFESSSPITPIFYIYAEANSNNIIISFNSSANNVGNDCLVSFFIQIVGL